MLWQAVFGAPGALGWAPSRLDAEVLWRALGGALLALAPWTYSLKARPPRRSRPQQLLTRCHVPLGYGRVARFGCHPSVDIMRSRPLT